MSNVRPLFSLFLILLLGPGTTRSEPTPFGIVHGPKGAFSITAPEGWVIDNEAGLEHGLPCVLFRKGESWETADPLMYAKIAGTDVTDHEAFAKKAIEEMTKERGDFVPNRIATGKTAGGEPFFVNEYAPTPEYPRCERVAYIQMPKAVAYIVFSAENKETIEKHGHALLQAVESLRAMDVKVEGNGVEATVSAAPTRAGEK